MYLVAGFVVAVVVAAVLAVAVLEEFAAQALGLVVWLVLEPEVVEWVWLARLAAHLQIGSEMGRPAAGLELAAVLVQMVAVGLVAGVELAVEFVWLVGLVLVALAFAALLTVYLRH